ncbi:MAG: protein-methionine-sulfoxide reductase catalytic subunit MsrP [Phycisphaerales bacterium]|nr:protein-methionine-sulfoxide reductase catalytic subunit MsrP [Phycisphaerales bacterium]
MPSIHKQPDWWISDLQPTDEQWFLNRRQFLTSLGIGGAALTAGGISGCDRGAGAETTPGAATRPAPGLYPAKRNQKFELDRPITRRKDVLNYINYYEFDPADKPRAVKLSQKLTTHPWTLKVTGLVKKPRTFDVEELQKRFPLEERLYRHRCVETWAMALPWTGFPLRHLLNLVEPLATAKYVRFVSFMRPSEAPGQHPGSSYPWPYHEGLRLDEALHDLALLATGVYGHPLPKQNGAPIRVVVPWKYGYKSIKAIVEIELVEKQPPTLWNTVAPHEYGFYSNVDPAVPHPRWSQAKEWMIDGSRMSKRATLPYNGYGRLVNQLYK